MKRRSFVAAAGALAASSLVGRALAAAMSDIGVQAGPAAGVGKAALHLDEGQPCIVPAPGM